MRVPRPFALIRTNDQWLRASHDQTALQGEVVQLYWRDSVQTQNGSNPFRQRGAGIAFDGHCRIYHSVPNEGRIERVLWAAHDPLKPGLTGSTTVNILAGKNQQQYGQFTSSTSQTTTRPLGLAVDQDERLFVAAPANKAIFVFDLWSNRLLRTIGANSRPVDLAANGRTVYAVLTAPAGLIQFSARGPVRRLDLPPEITAPDRIALSANGDLFILEHAGTIDARVIKFTDPTFVIECPFATDIEFQTHDPLVSDSCKDGNQILVIARRPGEDFSRFCISEKAVSELPPLKARGYDGLGVVCAPDGRIGFWTSNGYRHAVAARLRYFPNGSVTTFRLDSGDFHTVWGRLFLDACIPKDTEVIVRCLSADEPPDEVPAAAQLPANTSTPAPHPDLSPPMPPPTLAKQLELVTPQLLHKRETGRELPWVRPAETDSFETYEAPVLANPGRYLWIRIELTGNTRTTPRIRALRAEYPSHDYLRRLPQVFSRDDQVAGFLRRYLATFEGTLGELEAKADTRFSLLNPRSAPAEILPWLAGFLGLTLDERMARAPRRGGKTEDVRRKLISEATWLFRFRGTVRGLRRFVEIYLDIETILIEKFRVRGLGGAILGDPTGLTSSSILGAGLRVGGAIGDEETQTLKGSVADAFQTHAHRFALVIPDLLTTEQQDVVRQILELHRPAHTLVEVCTVGAGMRVGRGLHVALTSIVGRSDGFKQWQVGETALGRDAILGRAEPGTTPGGSRLGNDSRVG